MAPKYFFKSAKTPILKAFPGKAGGSHCFGKGYVRKRAKTPKMITVLGVFEFDAFLSGLFDFCKRKGVWGGGAKPPQKMRESDVRDVVVVVVVVFDVVVVVVVVVLLLLLSLLLLLLFSLLFSFMSFCC